MSHQVYRGARAFGPVLDLLSRLTFFEQSVDDDFSRAPSLRVDGAVLDLEATLELTEELAAPFLGTRR